MSEVRSLARYPIHLGLGAKAIPQPEFTGIEWYQDYGERNTGDGAEGRLVTVHAFAEPWTMWEMHPFGDEVVVCLNGEITLVQESRCGDRTAVTLQAGEYAINPAGAWHTADVSGTATALFITAGEGTENRPR